MNKKRLIILTSGALIALLLTALVGATVVSADEPTPEPGTPFGRRMFGRGGGRLGHGVFGSALGARWTMFDTAAEALGLSPVELFTELHGGKSLDEIAEKQGVDPEAIHDAADAVRSEAMREAIQQAVEDGNLTKEQADWMLEGLEKGFSPMGRGFGLGHGRGGWHCPESE